MLKERSKEYSFSRKFIKATSILWLSMALATGATYFTKRNGSLGSTDYPGLNVLLGAIKEGNKLSNKDFFDSSEMDLRSLIGKMGVNFSTAEILAFDKSGFPINVQYYPLPIKFSKSAFDSVVFPEGAKYAVGMSASSNDEEVVLDDDQKKALKNIFGGVFGDKIACTSYYEIALYNFGENDKEALVLKEVYLNKDVNDGDFIGHLKYLKDIDLSTGQINTFWQDWTRTGTYSDDIPSDVPKIMDLCG